MLSRRRRAYIVTAQHQYSERAKIAPNDSSFGWERPRPCRGAQFWGRASILDGVSEEGSAAQRSNPPPTSSRCPLRGRPTCVPRRGVGNGERL